MPAKFFLSDANLQSTLTQILEDTWDAFPQLAQNQVAIAWVTYDPPYRMNTGGALSAEEFWQYQPKGASYRGVELIEPAHMVTLFYMVAMHVWLEQGMVSPSPEIERALIDMMVLKSESATSYIIDVLSGTTSGPELPAGPRETWQYQRNIINRYFQQLGWPELRGTNINQKIWPDSPYGREYVFLGKTLENKNLLSTEAVARLFHSIVGGVSVSSGRSQAMMTLLKSNTSAAKVWSLTESSSTQPSSTQQLQHSATYIEADNIHPYLLVIFTETEHITNNAVITFISERIFAAAQQSFVSTEIASDDH